MTMIASSASPFAFAHKYMFGWGKGNDKDPTVEIIEYDTRPETLKICIPRAKLPDALWRMISAFLIPTPITFELWKLDENTYANWYGQMSYGTCWFRGCKVWLAPAAGLTMQLKQDRLEGEFDTADEHRLWTEGRARHAWATHLKSLATSADMKVKYDTARFPFRLSEPALLSAKLAPETEIPRGKLVSDSFAIIADIYDGYNKRDVYECERHHAAFFLSKFAPDSISFHVHPANILVEKNDPYEGGDPEVVALRDRKSLSDELSWIQEVGRKNHAIQFEWI